MPGPVQILVHGYFVTQEERLHASSEDQGMTCLQLVQTWANAVAFLSSASFEHASSGVAGLFTDVCPRLDVKYIDTFALDMAFAISPSASVH